jgi:hypothetical protein
MRFLAACFAILAASAPALSAGQEASNRVRWTDVMTTTVKVHRSAHPPVRFDPDLSAAENNQVLQSRDFESFLLVTFDASQTRLSPREAVGTQVRFTTAEGDFLGQIFALARNSLGGNQEPMQFYARIANRQNTTSGKTIWALADGQAGKLSIANRQMGAPAIQARASVRGAGAP